MLVNIRSAVVNSFFLLYPFLVFIGIQKGIVGIAPLIIATLFFYQSFRESRPIIRIRKFTLALVIMLGAIFFQSLTAKLLPTLIQLFLMYFFYKTLVQGPPLIERFVRLEFSELPAGVVEYCRQLTIIWIVFFALNAIICSVLAISGLDAWWAIYTGIIIFVLTGLLMIGEYIYRHYRFPDMEIPDIMTSARNIVLNARQIWLDLYAA